MPFGMHSTMVLDLLSLKKTDPLIVLCTWVFCLQTCLYTSCMVGGACGGPKRGSDLLKQELETIKSYHRCE